MAESAAHECKFVAEVKLPERTCLDTCFIISRRSASASSCILAVTSLLPARLELVGDLGGDLGGDTGLPLEDGGDGDLCSK